MPTDYGDTDLDGAGPFQFESPALDTGESWLLNFKNADKGRYKEYLPFDVIRVVNESAEPLDLTVNGVYDTRVVANSITTWEEVGTRSVAVANAGSASINATAVRVEAQSEPFGADDKARESRAESWVESAVSDIVPGGNPFK
jgi:hypothetical protein